MCKLHSWHGWRLYDRQLNQTKPKGERRERMKIHIELTDDNAAFESGHEIERILRKLSDNIGEYILGKRSKLMDINGNTVGTVEIEN